MTSFCIPSSVVSWRGMSHRSSLCLRAAAFTQAGIRLNKGPLKTRRCRRSRVMAPRSLTPGLGTRRGRCQETAGLWQGMLTDAQTRSPSSVPPNSSPSADSIRASIHVPSLGSFRSTATYTKSHLSPSLNTRRLIRGSGVRSALAERQKKKKERNLRNARGRNLSGACEQTGWKSVRVRRFVLHQSGPSGFLRWESSNVEQEDGQLTRSSPIRVAARRSAKVALQKNRDISGS